MGRLSGQVALITGGGTGIGRATALLFADEGADVVVNYSRSEAEAAETVEQIRKKRRRATMFCADISDNSAVESMMTMIGEEYGRLDILVNNAGTTRFLPAEDLESIKEEDWDLIYSTNVKGAFYCARSAIRLMKPKGGGQIINVSSIAGYLGQGSSIPYSVSKAAMVSLTKALAISQAPGIRVNAVAPGIVETRWIRNLDQDFKKRQFQQTPMQRVASPDDIAIAIYSLAINTFVTGRTLIVDGGRTLR